MNDHMTTTDYWLREALLRHAHHDVNIVTYGTKTVNAFDPYEVSLECNTCFDVITTYALDNNPFV